MNKEKPPLEGVIKNLIETFEKREEGETNIIKAWRKAAGEKSAKHTKPESLTSGKLIVTVASSSWLYKLNCEKKEIIKKINKELNKKQTIKEIQLRIGQIGGTN